MSPSRVTPPFVPRGTCSHGAVIKNGSPLAKMPSSELNVSDVTAAYCAIIPIGSSFCKTGAYGPAETGTFDEMNGVLNSRYMCSNMSTQAKPELART